jgi:serine/threonine-protein kinase
VLSTRSAVSLVGAGPAPGLHLRSAGSSLARVESGQAGAPLIAVRPSASPGSDGPARTLDWLGDNNVFRGWANWFEAGTAPERVVPHLVAARVLWPTSEARSRERPEPLAASVGGPLTTPSDVAAGLPELRATLAAVPEPSAYLVEKTIGSFELMPVAVSPPGAILPDLELTFNAADPDFAGDLGRFLASRVRPGPKQIRVVAQGQGAHASTPYRLPDGARLSIHVAPATPPLEWVPAGDGDAPLIEGHGSDLELIGAHLRNPGPGVPIDLIHLEDGRLTLLGCRLVQGRRDRDATAVRVVARTSRPLPPPTGLPTSAPGASLPWARISDSAVLATGTAIIAELARGAVRLNHCAVSGARTAIELRPQAVRRSAFLADLALERCTLAAGQDAIRLGPWTGSQRGPDRPWLVSGRECVVLVPADASGRRNDPGVALRGDLEGLPRGALLWQGGSNVYNVARLVALADQPPPNPGPRPDVTREWLDVWGSSHVQRVFGPGRAVPPPPGGTAPALAPAQGLPLPPRLTADALIRAGTLLGPEFGARPQPPPDVVVAASPVTAPAARPGANPAAPAATGPIGKPPSAATNRPF